MSLVSVQNSIPINFLAFSHKQTIKNVFTAFLLLNTCLTQMHSQAKTSVSIFQNIDKKTIQDNDKPFVDHYVCLITKNMLCEFEPENENLRIRKTPTHCVYFPFRIINRMNIKFMKNHQ